MRRSVSAFMPGERIEDAMAAASLQQPNGIGTIFTRLGENLTRVEDAGDVTRHYLDVLDRISAAGLDAQISAKPTQLGLDLDKELCFRNLQRLVDRAAERQNFVWIDMESSPCVDPTLDLFRRTRAVAAHRRRAPGLSVQNHAGRRVAAAARLRDPPGEGRVSGARRRRVSEADVDENFYTLSCRMLSPDAQRAGTLLHIATHDPILVDRLNAFITEHTVPSTAYEFAMLFGIQRPLQLRLAKQGRRIRVLIAYGEFWFQWYMRRLAERPANVWFVVRNLFAR